MTSISTIITRIGLVLLSAAAAWLGLGCGATRSSGAIPSSGATRSSGAIPSSAAAQATAPTVSAPATPAGRQLRWLLAAQLPIPADDLRHHFSSTLLARGPAALNLALERVGAALTGSGPLVLDALRVDRPRHIVATVSRSGHPAELTVTLSLDSSGLIGALLATPIAGVAPTTWPVIDARLHAAAPTVRMLVADTTHGSCRPIHAVDAAAPAPLASVAKLYVLDALGRAISAHRLSWRDRLTVTATLKAPGSGELKRMPDGTRITVADAATKMIADSDNTATDMLIHRIGRRRVEAALALAGMADPALDRPFLTPREAFVLKRDRWPTLARRYLRAGPAGRRLMLTRRVDPMRVRAGAVAWSEPRDLDTIEWRASAADVCRAYTALAALGRRPGLGPLAHALGSGAAPLGLDPGRFTNPWLKAGDEPGVLTVAARARTRAGHTIVVVTLAQDRSAALDDARAAPALLAVVRGAFALSARSAAARSAAARSKVPRFTAAPSPTHGPRPRSRPAAR